MGFVSSDHPNIPEVQEAVARVLAAAKAAGKYAGMVRPLSVVQRSIPE